MHLPAVSALFACSILSLIAFALIAFVHAGAALPQALGQLNPPGYLSDDYYKVTGGPDLDLALERSSAYQGEERSLFLTLANRGHLLSFQVNEQPDRSRREEVLAAGMEAELEAQRTTAQEISVALRRKSRLHPCLFKGRLDRAYRPQTI